MKQKFLKPFLSVAALVMTTGASNAAIVFSDDFESPTVSTTYNITNTSQSVNTAKWVRSSNGFASDRNGIIRENRDGEAFVDATGSQAYALRYSSNVGLTSAFQAIGALTAGTTITVTLDIAIQQWSTSSSYGGYNIGLVLFDGAGTRNTWNVTNPAIAPTFAVLANASGTTTAVATGAWQQIQFSYTVGESVVDNNGGAAGVNTAWNDNLIGKDIALRIGTGTYHALFDNVTVDISAAIPEPSAALLGGLGMLALLRRRR